MSPLRAPARPVLFAAFLLPALAIGIAAQKDGSSATRSTLSGVYTAEQARAGEATFGNICLGCHNLSTVTGLPFALRWRDSQVADLYDLIKQTMPSDAAGSLTPAQAAQLVSYLLKMNGMPAGPEPLPTEAAVLRGIRIEIPEKE